MDIPLSRFKPMTATVTSGLVPEPLRCFARVVDRFELADLDESLGSPRRRKACSSYPATWSRRMEK